MIAVRLRSCFALERSLLPGFLENLLVLDVFFLGWRSEAMSAAGTNSLERQGHTRDEEEGFHGGRFGAFNETLATAR